jgi:hypothetical protein
VEQTIFDVELNGSPFSSSSRARHTPPERQDFQGVSLRSREARGSGLATAALAAAAAGALWQGLDQEAVPAVFPATAMKAVVASRPIDDGIQSASSRLAAIGNDAAPSATELGWSTYLRSTIAKHVAREQQLAAIQIWERLRQVSSRFPLPQAGVVDGGRFAMAWDVGRYHIDVEINGDGAVDWFYLDRISGDADDGERCSVNRLGALVLRAQKLVG